MLTIKLPAIEGYDEASSRFIITEPELKLELEHSLVALSKWEAIWEKPFLSKDRKTSEEVMSYVSCMLLDSEIPPEAISRLTPTHFQTIQEYIESKQTATWFNDPPGMPKRPNQEIVTNEVIYFWMINYNIPAEYDKWHLRKLITLIEVCNKKSQDPKKTKPTADSMAERARLNAERRKLYETTG